MPKKTKEEVLTWAKDPDRKKGDTLVVHEVDPTDSPAIEKIEKVITKL
ncbi:hypothetical protein ES705_10354 [subsurface metagenome]